MLIRWLGAFSMKESSKLECSLTDSLNWEFGKGKGREVCAEIIGKGQRSNIWALVGLLVNKTDEIRSFEGDVWSVRNESTGRPEATRKGNKRHTEAWVKAHYSGVVVKCPQKISKDIWTEIHNFVEANNIPLYVLERNGKLRKWRKEVTVK